MQNQKEYFYQNPLPMIETKRTNAQDKGELNGSCNITACQKPNSATWFNHSTQKYYCEECAYRLNNDVFNKAWALKNLGHDLCTKETKKATE